MTALTLCNKCKKPVGAGCHCLGRKNCICTECQMRKIKRKKMTDKQILKHIEALKKEIKVSTHHPKDPMISCAGCQFHILLACLNQWEDTLKYFEKFNKKKKK